MVPVAPWVRNALPVAWVASVDESARASKGGDTGRGAAGFGGVHVEVPCALMAIQDEIWTVFAGSSLLQHAEPRQLSDPFGQAERPAVVVAES